MPNMEVPCARGKWYLLLVMEAKSLSVVSALRLAHRHNHGVMENLNQLQKLQVLNS